MISAAFAASLALGIASTEASCKDLALTNFDSDISIEFAEARPATDSLPSFCQVRGTIDPNLGFEARLPLSDWNGKFFMAGCGGFCGVLNADGESQSNTINYALRKGYAALITDGGHRGKSIGDGLWALNNRLAEEVYAHRMLPLGHTAGHQLIEQLYKRKPTWSYFSGCSNGGRLAAMAAQRYPTLFNGIIAGCSVLNLSDNGGVFGAWILQSNTDEDGRLILDHHFASKLPMLEANAYAECDAQDGKEDGVIHHPQNCAITLKQIPNCSNTVKTNCLSDDERRVVLNWYRGPHNSQNERLFAGVPPGSERYWGFWYLGGPDHAGPGTLLATDYGRYLGFDEDPAGFSALDFDFDFDTDIPKLAEQGRLFNALDPDLSALHSAGGKLLMWHGLADPLVLAEQSRDYYYAVVATMGEQKTSEVLRLFLAPGMGHCWELPAALPDQMDILSALERWVEQGVAPEQLVVTARASDDIEERATGTLNAYPQQAEYNLVE